MKAFPQYITRVFVDAHCFDQGYEGIRIYIQGLYSRMQENDKVHLFLAAHDIRELSRHFPEGPRITLLPYRSKSKWKRMFLEIPALIRKHCIDYAHFQYFLPPFLPCKTILTTHDLLYLDYPEFFPYRYRKLRQLLFGWSLRRADHITTVSRYSAEAIQRLYPELRPEVHVIPNGVNHLRCQQQDTEAAKAFVARKYGLSQYLLAIGCHEPRKNHLQLLKAWTTLASDHKNLSLVFVGAHRLPTPEFDRLYRSLDQRLQDRVHFLQQVPSQHLGHLLRAASVFVYPSLAEGFGIPCLEAGLAGVPVICSNHTAMREYDFFGAGHIDPSGSNELAAAIRSALLAPLSTKAREAIAREILARYNWEQSAFKLAQLIHAPLETTSPPLFQLSTLSL